VVAPAGVSPTVNRACCWQKEANNPRGDPVPDEPTREDADDERASEPQSDQCGLGLRVIRTGLSALEYIKKAAR